MTVDEQEWNTRVASFYVGAIFGPVILFIVSNLTNFQALLVAPSRFFNFSTLLSWFGLGLLVGTICFVLVPGKFHKTLPNGKPVGSEGRVLINQNGAGGLCSVGCCAILILPTFPLWFFSLWLPLGLVAALVLFHKRVQYQELDPKGRTMKTIVTWGGLQFEQQTVEICAVACQRSTMRQKTGPPSISYHPVLVLGDGRLYQERMAFFRANSEAPMEVTFEAIPSEPGPVLERLQGWGQSMAIPVLADAIEDAGAFLLRFKESGIAGLAVLGDWNQAPSGASTAEPVSSLPPE